MIIWKWYNNELIIHRFRTTNSYYVPAGKCLLSLQNWDKSKDGNFKACKGIGKNMPAHTTVLLWNHRSNKLDIPLGYHNNVATLNLAPYYQKFQAFESVLKLHTTQVPLIAE